MTQKDKELLLKDLCGRIPYNVKGRVNDEGVYIMNSVSSNGLISFSNTTSPRIYEVQEFKPYLFPLSSLTDDQKNSLQVAAFHVDEEDELDTNVFLLVDWCNEHHFDYRNLIGKKLALDATNLNIYESN